MKIKLSAFITQEKTLERYLRDDLCYSKNQIKNYFQAPSVLKKIIKNKSELSLPVDLINNFLINPNYIGQEIEQIHDCDIFTVFNKPSSIHAHPLKYSDQNTIHNFLQSKGRKDLMRVNKQSWDRGLIQRLDFETSGISIFAKSDTDYIDLRSNFSSIAKEKSYLCIVRGRFDKEGDHLINLDYETKEKKKVIPLVLGTFRTKTNIILKEYNQSLNLSLLHVKIQTGARHQIRAVLSSLSFPILGDILYRGEKAERVFLHAFKYSLNYKDLNYDFETLNAELFSNFFDLNGIFKVT